MAQAFPTLQDQSIRKRTRKAGSCDAFISNGSEPLNIAQRPCCASMPVRNRWSLPVFFLMFLPVFGVTRGNTTIARFIHVNDPRRRWQRFHVDYLPLRSWLNLI